MGHFHGRTLSFTMSPDDDSIINSEELKSKIACLIGY